MNASVSEFPNKSGREGGKTFSLNNVASDLIIQTTTSLHYKMFRFKNASLWLSILLFTTLLYSSCNNEKKGPDVSDIKVDVQVERFEKDFFSLDTTALQSGMQTLSAKYPTFFTFFTTQVMQLPVITPDNSVVAVSPDAANAYRQIISGYRPVYNQVVKKYTNTNFLEEGLEKGFQHVKFYYPTYQLPKVITFIAPFDVPGVVLTPQYLCIGLQQFAGKDFEAYQDPQIREMYPEYISRRFDKEYMVAQALNGIVDDIYPNQTAGRPLIEQMIEKGKQWYLLNQFLPNEADSIKTGFTKRQLNWLNDNEGNVWGFFSTSVDIYTIDPAIIKDYLGEGPFTRGMPEGYAPGNIGQWVGLRIVEKFAEKNEGMSLQKLVATPAKTIFTQAKYKPK